MAAQMVFLSATSMSAASAENSKKREWTIQRVGEQNDGGADGEGLTGVDR